MATHCAAGFENLKNHIRPEGYDLTTCHGIPIYLLASIGFFFCIPTKIYPSSEPLVGLLLNVLKELTKDLLLFSVHNEYVVRNLAWY